MLSENNFTDYQPDYEYMYESSTIAQDATLSQNVVLSDVDRATVGYLYTFIGIVVGVLLVQLFVGLALKK